MPKPKELADRGLSGLTSAMQRQGGTAAWKERMLATETPAAVVVETVETTVVVAETPEVPYGHIAVAAYFKSLEVIEADPVAIWLSAERELAGAAA